jgi:uroporphyrinogen decarboxylase
MTPREIVKRAITFQNPPRLPMKFDIVGVNDCYDVWTPDPTGWTWGFQGRTTDEWGCIWGVTEVSNTGQVVEHPLSDVAALKNYQWPDPDDERRYKGFAEQMAGAGDRFVMFCFGQGIWERLHMLLGMDKAMLAFVRHKDAVHEILDRVLDHHVRVMKNCQELAQGRLDAAAMADDWGVQDRAFVSPKMFREFFKDRYKKWFDEIKKVNLHTWMHSCGKINTIVPELIEAGLEVINNQQPNTVGLREFGDALRGKICFEAIVDTQNTLPRGTHGEIRQQAHDICDYYGTPQGGLIASDYNDAEAIGVTTDRRYVMFEAFAERGHYPGYQEILRRARAGLIAGGHSWGRATEAATG